VATEDQRREYADTAHGMLKKWNDEKPDRQRRQAVAGTRV
jgi:hypothetical protein